MRKTLWRVGPTGALLFGFVLAVFGFVLLFIGSPQVGFAIESNRPVTNVGGTANAIVLTMPNVVTLSDVVGESIKFYPKFNDAAGGVTVQINSLNPAPLYRISGSYYVPVADHDLSVNTLNSWGAPFADIVYNGSSFVLNNPATGTAPVGTEIYFSGVSSNLFGYLIEDGSCYSQTTYAALYAYYGSSDLWATEVGTSCSSGQFHVPLANGYTAVAVQNQGAGTGALTSCTAGVTKTCGAQNTTLATGQIPQFQFTPTGTVSGAISGSQSGVLDGVSGSSGGATGLTTPGGDVSILQETTSVVGSNFSFSWTGNFNQISIGSASPNSVPTIQPTYQVYKAVKY